MSIATASDVEIAPAPARPLVKPLLLAAGCVALADWLFYGWQIGISLALFLAALGIAGVAGNRVHATRKIRIVMAAIFVAGLLALIEDVNLLSVTVATLATALFVIVDHGARSIVLAMAAARSRDDPASRSLSTGR